MIKGTENRTKKIGKIFDGMEVVGSRRTTVNGKPVDQYKVRCVECGTERWHNASSVGRCKVVCYQCNPMARPMTPNGTLKDYPKGLILSYRCMINRCTHPKDSHWKWYGGRGISVCREWMADFETFAEWAFSNGWAEGKTIDRINPDGNYEPSNCRWADKLTQANNIRTNIHLTYKGAEMTLAQFCKVTGANYDRARYLIFRKGISPEMALTMMQGVSA